MGPAVGAQATVDEDTPDQSVFDIGGGTVVLRGLAITGGQAPGYGGGVNIRGGTITVSDCDIIGNFAGVGGGISNLGTLTVLHSNISNNSAVGNSGGIENRGGCRCRFSTGPRRGRSNNNKRHPSRSHRPILMHETLTRVIGGREVVAVIAKNLASVGDTNRHPGAMQ